MSNTRISTLITIAIVAAAALGETRFRLPLESDSTGHKYRDNDPTLDRCITWRCRTGCGGVHDSYDKHGGTDYLRERPQAAAYAAASGHVKKIVNQHRDGCYTPREKCEPKKFGNYVWLEHGGGITTYYGHLELDTIKVREGDYVKCGDVLADVGNSGYSSAPHLHFEPRRGIVSFDPYYDPSCKTSSRSWWTNQANGSPLPKCYLAISDMTQLRSDGKTRVAVGQLVAERHLLFAAQISGSSDLEPAKLEIELRRATDLRGGFSGQATHESGWLRGGGVATIDRVYGLTEGTYHWRARVVGDNGAGPWESFGGTDLSADFRIGGACIPAGRNRAATHADCASGTQPTVTTTAAAGVTDSGATLVGTVSANGAPTVVSFEYGTTDLATTESVAIGATASQQRAEVRVENLFCSSAYRYRARASNAAGTVLGSDRTFTTSACKTCSIRVKQPNGGETFRRGDQVSISWAASGSACGSKQSIVLIRPDGSATSINDAASDAYTWSIPLNESEGGGYKIRVSDESSGTEDVSDVGFTIGAPPEWCSVIALYPNGGEALDPGTKYTVKWRVVGPSCGSAQALEVLTSAREGWVIALSATGGSYVWTVPALTPGGGHRLWVYDPRSRAEDESDGTFAINEAPPPEGCNALVISPNGGEALKRGGLHLVKWSTVGSATGCGKSETIDLIRPDGEVVPVAWAIYGESYNWRVPADLPVGSGYRLRVKDDATGAKDLSDADFSIVASP